MKHNRRLSKILLAGFGVIATTFTIGVGSYLTDNNTKGISIGISSIADKVVCYNETTDIYYTSIEKALDTANSNKTTADVIYVIPGTNPTIAKDCTISKEDTLILPYLSVSESGVLYRAIADGTMESTMAYDSIATQNKLANVYSNCSNITSTVTVDKNIAITNNGTLLIGGIQNGTGGGNVAGFVTTCAKMALSSGAKIQNNGKFVNFGYVVGEDTKETADPHIINAAGSTTYAPFVVVEHRGGTAFSNLYTDSVTKYKVNGFTGSPFNRFYFPSFVNTLTKYEGSATFTGIPDLHTNTPNQSNRCEVSIIGEGGLIDPQDNFSVTSFFTFEANNGTSDLTNGAIPKNYLNFYGSFNVNSLSLTVVGLSITTTSCYFPISCYYDVQLNKSENGKEAKVASAEQSIKILPGARLVIGESVSFSCPGLVNYAKYDQSKYNSGTGEAADINGEDGPIAYEKMNSDGVLIVNGSLSVTEFGGFVSTNTSDATATLTFEKKFVTAYEVSADKSSFYSFIMTSGGYVGSDSNMVSPMHVGYYVSSSKHWVTDIYEVSLSVKEGDTQSDPGEQGTFTITANCFPSPSLSSDDSITYSWSCPDGASLSSATGQTITLTTPANDGVEDIEYTVTCEANFTKRDGTAGDVETSGTFVASKIQTDYEASITADTYEIAYVDTDVYSEAKIMPSLKRNGESVTDYTVSYEIVDSKLPNQTKPTGTTTDVEYKDANDNMIAEINENGIVKPKGVAGTINVKAKFKSNNKTIAVAYLYREKDIHGKNITVHTINAFEKVSSSYADITKTRELVTVSYKGRYNDKKLTYVLFVYDIQVVSNSEIPTMNSSIEQAKGTLNDISTTSKYGKITNKNIADTTRYYHQITITSINNEDQSATLTFTVFGCSIKIQYSRTKHE